MKKVKPTSTEQCGCCKAAGIKVPAVWRSSYLTLVKYTCELHKPLIVELEEKDALLSSHMSEADYQTWGRL